MKNGKAVATAKVQNTFAVNCISCSRYKAVSYQPQLQSQSTVTAEQAGPTEKPLRSARNAREIDI